MGSAKALNKGGKVITIKIVGINDGLADGGWEGGSVRMVLGEVFGGERSVFGIYPDIDGSGADRVRAKGDKVVRATWVCRHLGLLGDARGFEFLMGSNCWDFDRGSVWVELVGVVDIGLGGLRRTGEGELTSRAEEAKGGVKVDVGGFRKGDHVFEVLGEDFEFGAEEREVG